MTDPERNISSTSSPAAVSIKLPPFWPADPKVWFAQIEAQFTRRAITSQKTRFDYVVSSLSPEFAVEVRDLLLRPPDEAPYDTLKAELFKHTAASEQHKLQELISGEELGDHKPTQLFRRMQQLLCDKLGTSADANSFLHELFLQRLPPNVHMVLASADISLDLSKPADILKSVFECFASHGIVINPSKCIFGVDQLDFLGHQVASQGVGPLPGKVAVIRDFPQPTSPCQLHRFIGMINFYHCFLPH